MSVDIRSAATYQCTVCKGRLTSREAYVAGAWRRAIRSTSTSRRSTSSPSRSASTGRATGSPTLASRVAEMLGVSRASAGEMLKRLEAEGLVERGEHKEALLTAAGRERAEKVVRKHRIIERLLTDFMGYTAAEAHVHADELGDTFTRRDGRADRGEARQPGPLPARLAGRPRLRAGREPRARAARRPRGRPRRATIVRLAEHDGELLHWFYDQGLVPGSPVSRCAAQPAAGQFTVARRRRRAGDRRERRRRALRPRRIPHFSESLTLSFAADHIRSATIRPSRGNGRENGLPVGLNRHAAGALAGRGAAPRRRRRGALGSGRRRSRHSLRRTTGEDRGAARCHSRAAGQPLRRPVKGYEPFSGIYVI